MLLAPGTMLSHYRLIEKIGAGGMGVVWKAEDTRLRRRVALKVLPQHLVANEERRLRFLREARTAAAVSHANIAHLYEINEADGIVFITMELVAGRTLRRTIGGKALPLKETLRIATGMAEALAEAHKAHVIHRDLKPENVIVTPGGHPKILDFGLAKLHEDLDEVRRSELSHLETVSGEMTREGKVLGTPAYMSPEQARGRPVDRRSDLFSFGITLYEMATGTTPFRGTTTTDMLSAIIRDAPIPAAEINPTIPPELERIIGKCLEKDPQDRYQHTDDLAVDLRLLKQSTDSGVQRVRTPSGPVAIRRSRIRRRLLLSAGLLVLLAVGITIIWRALRTDAGFHSGDRLVVADFTNETTKPGINAALRDALEGLLGQSTLVRVVPRRQLQTLTGNGGAHTASILDARAASALCARDLCSGYVVGDLDETDGGYRLTVEIHKAGLWPESISRTALIGSDDALLRGLHDLVIALRQALGEAPQALASTNPPTTGSLTAYQAYVIADDVSDREGAVAQYREAIRIDPEFADAYLGLSGTLNALARCRESRDVLERAYSTVPVRSRPSRESDDIYRLITFYDLDGALERLRVQHQRNPIDPGALGGLAYVHHLLGDHAASLAYLRDLYRLQPDYWTLRSLALSLVAMGRWNEIEPLVAQFSGSDSTPARLNSLLLLSDLGRLDVASMQSRFDGMEAEEEVIHGTSDYFRITALVALGRFTEAEASISASWRAGLNRSDRLRRLDTSLWKAWIEARRTGNPPTAPPDMVESACECVAYLPYLAAFAADQQLPDVLSTLITSYEAEPRLAASRYVEELLIFARGGLALTRHQPARAIELLEPITKYSPIMKRHHLLARAYAAAGMWERAVEEYLVVLREPQNRFGLANPASFALDEARVAEAYEHLGDFDNAARWYERFTEDWKDADPGIPELIEARIRLAALKSHEPENRPGHQ